MSGFSAVTYALSKKYTQKLFEKLEGVNLSFVDELPTKDISEKTIYFVPHSSDPSDYSYDEYMYVDGKWKCIGSTELHLEDYYTKEELKKELPNILPIATESTLGAVKIDNTNIKIDPVTGMLDVDMDSINDGLNLIDDSAIDDLF